MNAKEQAKIHALSECRFGKFSPWERRFAKAMRWLARNDKAKPLSKKQKYSLDMMVYRFRSQLAGNLPDHLMIADRPTKAAYGIHEKPELIADLFNGSLREPLERKEDEIPTTRHQRNLF